MATVKKIKKAQDGLCNWSSKRGGGVSCGRGGNPKTEEWKPGRTPRMSRREEEEADKEFQLRKLRRVSDSKSHTTSPGLRKGEIFDEYKKGSESFFGGDKAVSEARRGKKVVKKAKMGKKVVIKKSSTIKKKK